MAERRMTKEDIVAQLKRLSANYSFFRIDADKLNIWYDMLSRYDRTTVHKAITEWMTHNPKEPTVSDIIDQINAATTRETMSRRYTFEDPNQKTVRCRNCNDHGLVTVLYPSGVEAVRFCDCRSGERYGRPYAEDTTRKMDDFEARYLFGVGIKTFKAGKLSEERLINDNTGEVFIKMKFIQSKTIVEINGKKQRACQL